MRPGDEETKATTKSFEHMKSDEPLRAADEESEEREQRADGEVEMPRRVEDGPITKSQRRV